MKYFPFFFALLFAYGCETTDTISSSQRGGGEFDKRLCNKADGQCYLVGSAASWLLSIFETSISACKSHGEASAFVKNWFENNAWLVQKVKSESEEYAFLLKMQDGFWAIPGPDLGNECQNVLESMNEKHPLNYTMR
ncbi:MAG: hypothetical protein QMC38_13490 [Sinobacterium sp.]